MAKLWHIEAHTERHLRAAEPPKAPAWMWHALFPVSLLWLELLLRATTVGKFWPATAFVALFCVAFGLVLDLLASLASTERVNRALKLAFLISLGFVYGTSYFVYRSFKMFYDLSTVLNGAGHMFSGFSEEIAAQVLSPSGLLHILAVFVPALVYALVLMRHDHTRRPQLRQLAPMAGGAVLSYLAAFVLIAGSGTYGLAYTTRYSYQASIENFGLVASLQKELLRALSPTETQVRFVETESDVPEDESVVPEEPGEEVEVAPSEEDEEEAAPDYGVNALDIDFAKLASTTDGTWAALDEYVATLTPSSKNEMTGRFAGYNLIFVSAEALSAEAIREDTTPTLWRMATKGIQFLDYYQPASAGTTGGEYQNLFGMLPTDGGASFADTIYHMNELTMGWALNALGYEGWAFHNNEYTYYDRNYTHEELGYNHGYMGWGNGIEEWVTWQWPESDLEMVKGTFDNLYGDVEPFDVYYMSVSGHSDYSFDGNRMSEKWEDVVADLPYSDPVRAYLACNVDLDRAMEYLVTQLEERGIADRTVIVISADHFPYGLDYDAPLGYLPNLSELYGYEVQDAWQRDHNRLILWSESLEIDDPIVIESPTSSLDILPTLLNLFGIEWDSRLLPGRDVFSDRSPLVFDISYDWKTDLGTYFAGANRFIPAEGAEIPDGYVDKINATVANKITYCSSVLASDYMRHVLGDPRDVHEVNALGKGEAPKPIVPRDGILAGIIADAQIDLSARARAKGRTSMPKVTVEVREQQAEEPKPAEPKKDEPKDDDPKKDDPKADGQDPDKPDDKPESTDPQESPEDAGTVTSPAEGEQADPGTSPAN